MQKLEPNLKHRSIGNLATKLAVGGAVALGITAATAPALAQYDGQTVVVGGESRPSENVDPNYEVLEMLGPPRGQQRQQAPAPYAQPYGQPYGYNAQPVQQYPLAQPYQQPVQAYQAPQAYQPAPPTAPQPYSYQASAPQPVSQYPAEVRTPTELFQVDPGSYNIITVIGSPQMEANAKQSNEIVMSEGTAQLLGDLRSKVEAKDTDKRTLPRVDNETGAASLSGASISVARDPNARISPVRARGTGGVVAMQPVRVVAGPAPRAVAGAPFSPPAGQQQSYSHAAVAAASDMASARPYGMSDVLYRQAVSSPSSNPAFAAIVFPPDSNAITTAAQGKIAAAVRKVTGEGGTVQIVASAPALAMNDSAALGMAMRRAMVVRNVLLNNGVPENAIEIRAYIQQVQSGEQVMDKKRHRVALVRM